MPRLKIEDELREVRHLGEMERPVGITIIFGGQAGSEGKGAIAGFLARKFAYQVAISTFMPNAGHTFVDGDQKVVMKVLPVGIVNPEIPNIYLGASSVIDLDLLHAECERFDPEFGIYNRLYIHPRAQILLPEYKEWEAEHLKYIASTGQGCGAAIAAKARREQGVVLAANCSDLLISAYVMPDMDERLNGIINAGGAVLAEQSQGFDLDINHGHSYPFCTSRQCTPTQMCADMGLSERLVTHSVAVVRPFPIRVGNADGYSGDLGSKEVSWAHISGRAGRPIEERTTVTDRVRRVFEQDWRRLGVMSSVCRPTEIAATFVDYVDGSVFEMTHEQYMESCQGNLIRLSEEIMTYVYQLERAVARPTMNPRVSFLKTGPDNSHLLELGAFSP